VREPSLLLLLHPLKKRQVCTKFLPLIIYLLRWTHFFKKFDKLSVSVVTPTPVSPPCEFCGILGHTGVECQLGSVVESPEQLNYDKYNQGMRSNQNFYNKTPQIPFGQQTAPPGYANNQGVPQKSILEILLEKYVMDQSKHFQELKNQTGFLNDSIVELTSKVDSISTHQQS
jgi:hypothetical protein